MASEQFSLCWDNFHKNLSSGMSSLLETEDLVDVTIAVEGRYVKAHKMILSLCSPYFRELFKVNPCKHPIVVLKDVSFEAMSDLLQFMYQGEVQVSQENLSSFIKTAEALQIKGLTGDGSAVHEADLEPVETNEVVTMKPSSSRLKHKAQPSTGMPSAKKTKTSSNANITNVISTSSITSAKCKLSNSNDMEDETVLVPITREPAPRSSLKKEELTAFKMEPYEQVQQTMSVDDDDDDEDDLNDTNYTDDHLDDKNNEENVEEYPMLGEEPKPGTSSEATAAGEGQDLKVQQFLIKGEESSNSNIMPRKRLNRMRFVVDGFVYHNNVIAGNPPLRYLGCAENKRSGCRGRATIPVGGSLDLLRATQPHNHPPDINAEEKDMFVKELKSAVRSNALEKVTLKKVYETVAAIFPKAAEEILFQNISSSLHRWRKDPSF